MDIDQLRKFCSSLTGVTEDIKWENHLCFLVGGKIFCMASLEAKPLTLSFKTTPEDFDLLTARPGITQAPYLAKNSWVYMEDAGLLPATEFKKYLKQAYQLIAAKLTVKMKRELGIGNRQ